MTVKEQYNKYTMQNYSRLDICLAKGKGSTVWDENGKEYIDFGSGIGVNSLGYCNKGWQKAVKKQASKLQHASNYYYSAPGGELAELLCLVSGYTRALFCNSGAEANECAIKIARKYSFDKYGKEANRNKILTLKNSFHGRTVTTLSATGQEAFHDFFFPFTEGFCYADPSDYEQTEKLLASDKSICAVLVEFVQGEGGVCPLDKGFVAKLFDYCQKHDILVIADEVQTGIGRTGKLLACEHYSVKPNIVSLAKGLGGGLPIGAVIGDEKTADVLLAGQHGTTFGGNPVVCAGGVYALTEISKKSFLEDVAQKGEYIKAELLKMKKVVGVDGMGMMLGIRLDGITAAKALAECADKGLLALTAKEKLRLLPPLNISKKEIDKGLKILHSVLD